MLLAPQVTNSCEACHATVIRALVLLLPSVSFQVQTEEMVKALQQKLANQRTVKWVL